MRRDGLDDWQKTKIKAEHLVFGMINNPGNLLRMQAWVDGMNHRALATHGVVNLHMAIAIPGQGADAFAHINTARLERTGELPHTRLGVTVGITMNIAFKATRYDLGRWKMTRRMLHE